MMGGSPTSHQSLTARKPDRPHLINPFRIDVDPMERLLLVNFEGDPDETYVGFEPQVFDDAVHGSGHLVIGWRQDGRVDVFHQPSLTLTGGKYDIAGKGLAHMVEPEFSAATYEVDDFGVQAHYEFQDTHNRTVVINISEQNPRNRRPFGLLAPMGSAAEAPSSLPLVLLHDFYFVRKRHTTLEISIGGRRHRPDSLPVPIDGTRMTFTRYSPEPLIAKLNPAFDGELEPLGVQAGEAEVQWEDHVLALDWSGGSPAITRITRKNATYPIDLRFDRAFPDVQSLGTNTSLEGRFEIEGHPSTGRIVGTYTVCKTNDQTTITMIPKPGWKPRPTKISLRFLYTVAGVFKKWPTTYRWTAILRGQENGVHSMLSQWRRTQC